jgi:hypothetical protein
MARLAIAASFFALACGGASVAPPPQEPPEPPPAATSSATSEPCRQAQALEVETWIAVNVTDPDDEIELFTTLGMILTLTDPETLAELLEANPDALAATHASKLAWMACGERGVVNCAALSRALEETEARIGEDVWDDDAIDLRCQRDELALENADCALSASVSETARACF